MIKILVLQINYAILVFYIHPKLNNFERVKKLIISV